MYNVFEDVDDRRLRTVTDIKSVLLDYGALGAMMTGTGSAVFGVFKPESDTGKVCELLRKEYGFCERAVSVGRITD
jgi:4-diphosphocytidyl-2-C-methyl-D-erythritol kinase